MVYFVGALPNATTPLHYYLENESYIIYSNILTRIL